MCSDSEVRDQENTKEKRWKSSDYRFVFFSCLGVKAERQFVGVFLQLYLTGAVYSLDGSDSLKDTMQTSITAAEKVTAGCS